MILAVDHVNSVVRITDNLSMVVAVDCENNMVRITGSLSMVLPVDRGTVWLG